MVDFLKAFFTLKINLVLDGFLITLLHALDVLDLVLELFLLGLRLLLHLIELLGELFLFLPTGSQKII